MRNGTPHILSLTRTLTMLEAIIADGGRSSVAALARLVDVPVATAHRQVATLVAAGYLVRSGAGRHVAGSRLLGLAQHLDERRIVETIAAPLLRQLAAVVRTTVQLGTYENDMVTYRIKTGRGASGLFTRVGQQLEAYCSGIGKVLLAHLPVDERETYLAGGPFVALTARTITDPSDLRVELLRVRDQGYAVDDGEIAADLRCFAVPVRRADGSALAAISVSQITTSRHLLADGPLLALLKDTATQVERAMFGPAGEA